MDNIVDIIEKHQDAIKIGYGLTHNISPNKVSSFQFVVFLMTFSILYFIFHRYDSFHQIQTKSNSIHKEMKEKEIEKEQKKEKEKNKLLKKFMTIKY